MSKSINKTFPANKSRLIPIVLIYLVIFFVFTAVYLLLFHTPFFSSQKVLFYRGITLLVFTTLIFFILTLIFHYKYSKKYSESIFAAIIVSTSIQLSIFIVFPVTFERSLTMFLLSKLSDAEQVTSCHGLTRQQLEKLLIEEYVLQKDAVDKRINEQKIINNLSDTNKCIFLSKRGKDFVIYSNLIKRIYGLP